MAARPAAMAPTTALGMTSGVIPAAAGAMARTMGWGIRDRCPVWRSPLPQARGERHYPLRDYPSRLNGELVQGGCECVVRRLPPELLVVMHRAEDWLARKCDREIAAVQEVE